MGEFLVGEEGYRRELVSIFLFNWAGTKTKKTLYPSPHQLPYNREQI